MDCDYFQQLTFSVCRVYVCLSLEAETKQCLTLSAVSQISVERWAPLIFSVVFLSLLLLYNILKVSSSPSISPSPDQHPVPPERSVQPPVPPLHRGHPVHRREPGALQPQTHPEQSPEAPALPGSVFKITPQRCDRYCSAQFKDLQPLCDKFCSGCLYSAWRTIFSSVLVPSTQSLPLGVFYWILDYCSKTRFVQRDNLHKWAPLYGF